MVHYTKNIAACVTLYKNIVAYIKLYEKYSGLLFIILKI